MRKTTTLPDRDDMLRRLKSVEDNDHLVQYLYPVLLRYAGQQKTAAAIVIMLNLAIGDYCSDLGSPAAIVAMSHSRPDYVEALVDDKEIRKEALALL